MLAKQFIIMTMSITSLRRLFVVVVYLIQLPLPRVTHFLLSYLIKSLSATKKITHIVSMSYKLTDETLLKPKGPGAGHNLLALFDCLHADTQKGIVEACEVH